MLFTAFVLLAMSLQASLLPVFVLPPFRPDLLLVIMVFIALRGTLATGAPLAWFLGLCKDVCSGLYLGLNACTFLISYLIIKNLSDRLYADSAILFVMTVCGISLTVFTLNLLLVVMFTASPGITYSMLTDLVPHLLVNAFVASIVTAFPGFDSHVQTS